MYGVSRISSADNIMLIGYNDVEANFMPEMLNKLADAGVVVDMICQTAPHGGRLQFSFTAAFEHFDTALKALGGDKKAAPMISGGYSKVYLFGEEMVESVGVAARALSALGAAGVAVSLITTSDLDISLLVRQEDADVAIQQLRDAFSI
ncbi:MAG: ACT domain-containing protein [Ruminococcaceae bacterium]|nr:ACT domain-containing protein [Oscillospiraceae bacterium]